MHLFETNDRKVRTGDLNSMFSMKWIYLYALLALLVHVGYLFAQNRAYWREERLRPVLEERRKEFDPFESDSKSYAKMTQEETVAVKAKDLRTDSAFATNA